MQKNFQKDCWNMDGLTYAYSSRFAPMPQLRQKDDYVENIPEPASRDGYAYTSLVTAEKLQPGVTIRARCAFELDAAPLFVLARELEEKDGRLYYSNYLEVVIWKNGINVWELWKDEDGIVKIRCLLSLKLPLASGKVHDFSTKVEKEQFIVTLDDISFRLYCHKIYDSFHLGITACEGPCRFYDMQISEGD